MEAVCSQVLILNEGRIAAQGKPEDIAGTMKGGDTWELILKGADVSGIEGRFARLGTLSLESRSGGDPGTVKVSFFLPSGAAGSPVGGEEIFDWAVAEGFKILGMNRRKLSLEDIFVKLTAEERNGPLPAGGKGGAL